MSPATVDRRLAGDRARMALRGRSHTKPGSLLKDAIAIRTRAQCAAAVPGFVEIDLVGHEGGRALGEHAYTLTVADISTGWTENRSVPNKAPRPVPGLRPERVAPSGQLWLTLGRWSYRRRMVDEFTERDAPLLTGSYDCVDRVVLNAYYPLGHNPGGFRVWWRRWHGDSDAELDDAHLMRLAGRFARRVRAWAGGNASR